jgi:hypothetical protein
VDVLLLGMAGPAMVQERDVEGLTGIPQVVGEDAGGTDELGHLLVLEEADHRLVDLPDADGQDQRRTTVLPSVLGVELRREDVA